MERLSPLSYSFIAAEDVDRATSLVIGSVAVLEGPAPTLEELRNHVQGRLDRAPRYRERLQRSFLDLRAPGWVRDRGFDVERHVRAVQVAGPGGRAKLADVVGVVMAGRMDRFEALWDCWLCDGL